MKTLALARPRLAATLCAFALTATAHAQDWAPNITLAANWHDNATNAKPAVDRISAVQLTADMVASHEYSLGRYDTLQPTAHFTGEWWPRFQGLTQGAAGARLAWRHTLGADSLAPVISLTAGVDEYLGTEKEREGTRMSLLAMIRKRLTDKARITLSQEFSDHNARSAVYDQKASETALEFGRDINDVARVTLQLSYRHGDVITHASIARPDFEAISSAWLENDFFDRPLTAYNVEARTLGGKVALIRAIDKDSAIILAYEYRETERSPVRFLNQIGSLAIVHQF